MQTEDKKNKQLMIYTEINAIMKQSNSLLDILNANQKEVNKLKAESDKLEKEILGKAESENKANANNFFESRL